MRPVDLTYPFTGRWLVRNSPASRVPSHGTALFATSHAIDFVPVRSGRNSARFSLRSLFLPEPATRFPGFGRAILSPVAGTVVSVHDGEDDHDAYRGFRSLGYAISQRRRASEGWHALTGNHVMIRSAGGVIALCHLRRGSITVGVGQLVETGDHLAECGNSGNSTEAHLHLQAMDSADPLSARALPFSFNGLVPRTGAVVEVP
ncbi:M23 family metallopeptidase [Mycetocola tolaasinivorans]|uniref:M23 family metallopeptidase n=1 Tax=Mycetocola tolaasinivorans TaxID=76635 RepID=A0A3L6ZV72_9MICO|nr:M23 family metallopeptidase [Mycetocola tolaasinivorans]RLP71886.1 M23 family metallopeptidase [Mycetocola tolaasinivorans]